MKPTKTNQKDIEEFVSHINAGVQSWIKAGEIVARCCEQDPDWPEKVCEAHPDIQIDTVLAFERIGRGMLNPRLLLNDCHGFRKLRRMPKHLQEKYLTEPVPLLINKDGEWQTLKTDVRNLSAQQVNQAFDREGVRTEAQQRAWLEDRAVMEAVQIDDAYRISGRKLIILSPCQLTAKQLARILSDME